LARLNWAEGSKECSEASTGKHILKRQSVFDPFEGFESLKDYSLLQDAARQSWKQGAEWTKEHAAGSLPLGSTIPKIVAERVIDKHHVPPEDVRAAVIVLAVSGQWSNIAEPGVLLCSEELYLDDTLFESELKRTFESGLTETGEAQ
jgi:hypothetical protein